MKIFIFSNQALFQGRNYEYVVDIFRPSNVEGKQYFFIEPDIYFTKLMFILKNINLELKSALRTKYLFYRFLLYYVCYVRAISNAV